MSRHQYDTVRSSSCFYTTLRHYNKSQGIELPRSNTEGVQIVPAFNAIGYDTLTGGVQPSCSGFFNIENAYHSTGGNCNQQYVRRLCQ
jgi:organic hydroperoxide reductase OsmC/OhrA